MNFKELENVFIVAEMSANHNGSIEKAKETIKAAKRVGADAIKLQTYRPDTITLNLKTNDFLIKGDSIWSGQNLYNLYKKAYTPWEWHEELFAQAKLENIICFSSPFDFTAVDLLEDLGNPIYKIASFEITDIPLIKYVASKGKPIIMSTGIASEQDIELAIETCRNEGNEEIALLKCTSNYPAKMSDANLSMISDYQKRFGLVSGLSDHTLGITAPIVAVTQGAKIIEKHFILDKSVGGPDASFSLNEIEFKRMVEAVRESELALGEVNYKLSEKQKAARNYCRSLYIAKAVKKGDLVSKTNLKSVRPGYGMHPKYLPELIGKSFTKDCEAGTRARDDLFK